MTDIQTIAQNYTSNNNMEDKCNSISKNFYELKNRVKYSDDMIDLIYKKNENGEIIIKNINFFDLELIEESFDELFYEFSQIKNKLAEVRKQLFANDKK